MGSLEYCDQAIETCASGLDGDGDGLVACEDPDCVAYCTPMCPPLATCGAEDPYCGDGVCSSIENYRSCADDCSSSPTLCGDGVCEDPETAATCPADCPPA